MADAAFIRSLPQADQRAQTSAYGKIVYAAQRMFRAPPGLEEEESMMGSSGCIGAATRLRTRRGQWPN
jgi:hypothetical protein